MGRIVTVSDGAGRSVTVSNWGVAQSSRHPVNVLLWGEGGNSDHSGGQIGELEKNGAESVVIEDIFRCFAK